MKKVCKGYKESIEILEAFYIECLDFWRRERAKLNSEIGGNLNIFAFDKTDEKYAYNDIRLIQNDPTKPNGDFLNTDALAEFRKFKKPRS